MRIVRLPIWQKPNERGIDTGMRNKSLDVQITQIIERFDAFFRQPDTNLNPDLTCKFGIGVFAREFADLKCSFFTDLTRACRHAIVRAHKPTSDEVATLRDDRAWKKALNSEDDDKANVSRIADNYDDVIANL